MAITPEKKPKGPPLDDFEELADYKRKKKKVGGSMAQPPLVPLIDVFLFLIIFFLLSCQFHQSEGTIPANLPNTLSGLNQGGATMQVDPIRITLRVKFVKEEVRGQIQDVPKPVISVVPKPTEGTEPDSMASLFEYLQKRRARYADSAPEKLTVVIRPAQEVPWGLAVDAFNQAVRAGFSQVGFAPSGKVD